MSSVIAPFIAIDGPVASGKTVAGKILAGRLGHAFLDTGVMYRAVTYLALQQLIPLDDPEALTGIMASSGLRLTRNAGEECRVLVNSGDITDKLRSSEVDRSVSIVSAVPGVRKLLVELQREIATLGQVVMVGRDIGTVVMSGAGLKVYLDASVTERASRRYRQLQQSGSEISYQTVLDDLTRRDYLDSSRELAPLKQADDAIHLLTDDLNLDQVVDRLEEMARGKTPWRLGT
ncbi:MAG: (d)CMP kinase [Dehalococcoidia bacterium]